MRNARFDVLSKNVSSVRTLRVNRAHRKDLLSDLRVVRIDVDLIEPERIQGRYTELRDAGVHPTAESLQEPSQLELEAPRSGGIDYIPAKRRLARISE